MTKCETRKQLSYSRLGTGIFQENGGLIQVLRRVKPHTCMIDINNSVILTKGGGATKRRKSGKSSSQIMLTICNSRPSCMICESGKLWRIQRKKRNKIRKKIPFMSFCPFFLFFIFRWNSNLKEIKPIRSWLSKKIKETLNFVCVNKYFERCLHRTYIPTENRK